jgi:hypothetical protein
MSLDFNLIPIRERIGEEAFEKLTTNPEDLGKKEQRWHPVTDSLIWLSMLCGFNEITEKNADMIAKRIAAYQNAFGPYLKGNKEILGDEPLFINILDVRAHIGLRTNASSKTDAKFKSWLGDTLMREANNSRHLKAEESVADRINKAVEAS